MGLVISVQPTTEPVTTDELRTHLRLDSGDFDAELSRLITAARNCIEARINRQLINATYQWTMDYWPDYIFELPMGPLSSVTSITYHDTDEVSQTWSSSNYQVDTTTLLGTITLTSTATYPSLQTGKKNAITVTFVAGGITVQSGQTLVGYNNELFHGGSVSGRVTGPAGAALYGTTVLLVDPGTDRLHSTATNAQATTQ